MFRVITSVVLCLVSATSVASAFTFSNSPGPHPVGLRVKPQYDYSRVFKGQIDLVSGKPTSGERARPIQALVWYPAQGKGQPITYRDYLATMAAEDDLGRDAKSVQVSLDSRVAKLSSGPRAEVARQEIVKPMLARRDAPEKPGKYPVVIYAPGSGGSAIENADLCEYLASQGYVVLASPSLGPRTRTMTSDLEGVEAQAADIAFLIGYAHSLAQADTAHIGVIGFSWGGLANVLAAAKDDRISALVSLDGSMRGFTEFVNGGKDAAKYVTPARLAIPLLYVAKKRYSPEQLEQRKIDTTFSLMNRMKYSDVYLATMPWMSHMDFTSMQLRFGPDSEFEEYSRDEISLAHSWVARYVHRFLDAYLKGDRASREFLDNPPAKNKVPAHMMSLDIRHGKDTPPTVEAFVRTLNEKGFNHAADLYQRMHKDDPAFVLDENWINRWGWDLLTSGRKQESLEIYKLAVQIHPEEAELFDSLADVAEQSGQRELAIANYRRALELNPQHRHAGERLKVLGATAGQ